MDSYRTFIAIELPPELRARIVEHIDQLRRELPDVRASWTRKENLHLTLKFLGDVPVADVSKLSLAVEAATRAVTFFELAISGCGAFPPHGQPKGLWMGITEASGELTKLHEAVELECERVGFAREARAFRPHLTVARLRSAKGARRLARLHSERSFDSYAIRVTEVCVMRSELSSEGSRHTVIARHQLGMGESTA